MGPTRYTGTTPACWAEKGLGWGLKGCPGAAPRGPEARAQQPRPLLWRAWFGVLVFADGIC